MRRILAIIVFATAAGAAAAAGSGVYVAPHVDPPGTPLFHTHVLAAYRLPIFLDSLRVRWDPRQGLLSEPDLFSLAQGGPHHLGVLRSRSLGRKEKSSGPMAAVAPTGCGSSSGQAMGATLRGGLADYHS